MLKDKLKENHHRIQTKNELIRKYNLTQEEMEILKFIHNLVSRTPTCDVLM